MKKFLSTLAVFSVLIFIGCQENSITDPLEDVSQQELPKSDDSVVHHGFMELEGILEVPAFQRSFLQINGQVGYVHELVLVDPIPPAPQHYVSISLQVNAELTDPYSPMDPVWTIEDRTEDVIYVSEDGIYLLEKYYSIKSREDGLILACRFLVTTDGVGLNEMWLILPEGNSNNVSSPNDLGHVEVTYPPIKKQVAQ